MLRYIFLVIFANIFAFSQDYNGIINQILTNNKQIKVIEEQLNVIYIESKFNSLPSNPEIEYSYLKNNTLNNGDKQEFLFSLPFEFPTIYSIKSDISALQNSVNKLKLKEYKKNVILNTYNLLAEITYKRKIILQLLSRIEDYENIYNAKKIQFEKSEIGILEFNKAKSLFLTYKTKLNYVIIEVKSLESALIELNGGKEIKFISSEYPIKELPSNFDSLLVVLKEKDFVNKAFEEEINLQSNKVSVAKLGWLPSFSLGYRFEKEAEFNYSGLQFSLSIPLFENQNKVPKQESEMKLIKLQQQTYLTEFEIEKKKLIESASLWKKLIDEQRDIIDDEHFNLTKKSFETGNISLTQYFIDNSIYYETTDSILEAEYNLHKSINSILIELITNSYMK